MLKELQNSFKFRQITANISFMGLHFIYKYNFKKKFLIKFYPRRFLKNLKSYGNGNNVGKQFNYFEISLQF